jgi:segregation and condensation protein B
MVDQPSSDKNPNESPLSLSRLREAFAAMLGERSEGPPRGYPARSEESTESLAEYPLGGSSQLAPPCEINPRSVVEAMLFVGRPDNGSFSSRELAAAMRGVSPGEIEEAVRDLNAVYEADGTPYLIEGTKSGYRLVLRQEYARLRDKFYGNVREAKLSPAALEVLSIVAYNQPVTLEEINGLRNASNGGALATLVRRGLVRLDRPAEAGGKPQYSTTQRFLNLFGLEALEALPRSEELEKV